jgi:hypothetical protein
MHYKWDIILLRLIQFVYNPIDWHSQLHVPGSTFGYQCRRSRPKTIDEGMQEMLFDWQANSSASDYFSLVGRVMSGHWDVFSTRWFMGIPHSLI